MAKISSVPVWKVKLFPPEYLIKVGIDLFIPSGHRTVIMLWILKRTHGLNHMGIAVINMLRRDCSIGIQWSCPAADQLAAKLINLWVIGVSDPQSRYLLTPVLSGRNKAERNLRRFPQWLSGWFWSESTLFTKNPLDLHCELPPRVVALQDDIKSNKNSAHPEGGVNYIIYDWKDFLKILTTILKASKKSLMLTMRT